MRNASGCEEQARIGRNEPCPCGSGKKHKKCCAAAETLPSTFHLEDALAAGLHFHTRGQLPEAEAVYRKILEREPGCARALHLMGVIGHQVGRYDDAVVLIEAAISADPNVPEFHSNLGNALDARGETARAVQCYATALQLKPDSADAYNNLGIALRKLGRLDDAVKSFELAITYAPRHPLAHTNLGVALLMLNRIGEAIACHQQALAIDPENAEALGNFGAALKAAGREDEAVLCFRRALELKPDSPEVLNNLGVILKGQQRNEEAVDCYRKALAISPNYADAHNNLGAALKMRGAGDEAIEHYTRALALNPNHGDAHGNLGIALKERGESRLALQHFDRALASRPDSAVIRTNRAVALLMAGDLERGWAEFEWRWKADPEHPERACAQPRWDGSSLAGKTILVWTEQGLGDEIIFAGMLPDLAAGAGHVVLECVPRLLTLFRRSFPSIEVLARENPLHPRTAAPGIDFQSPIGSLARWLRPTLESFPERKAYLKADPGRVEFWKERLRALGPGLNAGICWRSKLVSASRSLHYTSLDQWGPIFRTPGVHFINLQYDDCRAELAAARERFGIQICEWEDIDLMNDQDDLAALMSALDVVISAGTAVASLGGAIGKPTWVFDLRSGGDWTTLGTARWPWLPSVRLFERDYHEPWEPLLDRIGAELSRFAGGASNSGAEAK